MDRARHIPAVRLRAVEPSDADFMYEMENDSDCRRYSDTVAPLSRRQLREYALNYDADPFAARQLRLVIVEAESGAPAGAVDLYDISPLHRHAMVGIYILPHFRRRGLALEALTKAAAYAHEALHLRILAARIEDSNAPSLRLFSKGGYTLTPAIPGWFATPSGSRRDLTIAFLPL